MSRFILCLLFAFIGVLSPIYAEITVIEPDRLCEAIKQAENSVKYPYGIKSIPTNGDIEYARRICLNTINNNLPRWQYAAQNGDTRDFITFLGDRYCPKADDPQGNAVWAKNVKHFYGE